MAKVLLHSPLNISRAMGEMIKEFSRTIYDKYGIVVEIETQPHRPEEESLFSYYVEQEKIPDVIIGHANDFAGFSKQFLADNFLSLPGRFPLRKELVDAGFLDKKGYFHTFAVIPFSILYNHHMMSEDELPRRWEDLLDTHWNNSILMPDGNRVVSIIVRTFMESNHSDRFHDFTTNVICQGSPIDVVNAVDEGQYPIGVANIAWARVSRQKNTSLIWPEDGAFCIPQIMVWRKGIDKRLLEIGDFLMSPKMQEFMATQSFVPASPDFPLPSLVMENNCSLHWESWEHFLKTIKGALV